MIKKIVEYHILERQSAKYHLKLFVSFFIISFLWLARYIFNPKIEISSKFFRFYFKMMEQVSIPITEYEMFLNARFKELAAIAKAEKAKKELDILVQEPDDEEDDYSDLLPKEGDIIDWN